MRRRRTLVLLLATLLLLTMAVPANAKRPADDGEPIFLLFPDLENHVSVFWNMTAENFCDWQAGGFEGEPPVEELVPADIVVTDEGAIEAAYNATRPLELWQLDDDVPPLIGPCDDIENQDGPWATGRSRVVAHDNDLEGDTLPVNGFGESGRGTVYDTDGAAWSYSWFFRARIGPDDFRIIEESTLSMLQPRTTKCGTGPQCLVPPFEPPAHL